MFFKSQALNLLSAFALFSGLVGSSHASMTIFVSDFFGSNSGGIAYNFANGSGVVSNGMKYGILIDTTGNGFQTNLYTSFNTSVGGFLSTVSGITDDYYYFASSPNDVTQNSTAFGGGNGSLIEIAAIPDNGDVSNGVTVNDVFGLIWFSSNTANTGDKYGFLSDSTFKMPASGTDTSIDSFFVGAQPVRTASNTIAAAIPEPSRMMLLGFGLAGLFFRRRR